MFLLIFHQLNNALVFGLSSSFFFTALPDKIRNDFVIFIAFLGTVESCAQAFTEYEISLVAKHRTEETQKIIDCLKIYLQSIPAHLKETKEQLNVLGFYNYEYNKKIAFLMEAKKQLRIESK